MFDVKTYDLGEYGIATVEDFKLVWPGRKNRFDRTTHLSINVRYYPNNNEGGVNFVQTVSSNLEAEEVVQWRKRQITKDEIEMREHTIADGGTPQGTYYTPSELRDRIKVDDQGLYYDFSDFPGRPYIRGERVKWNAELSIVKKINDQNTSLITFSYGFFLRSGRKPKVYQPEKTEHFSSHHQKNIDNAVIE